MLPNVPSIFDKKRRQLVYISLFFHSFVNDLSRSIKRDNKIHIEYVPTQIMTEYFRYVYPEISKNKIDGILYPSSKKNKGKCCVLFFDNETSLEYFDLENIKTMSIKP